MAGPVPETLTQDELESALHSDQHHKNHLFSLLGRQSSIYSLTLDEFQHTLCESGKNFGSMNMDEFLTSIWNAEENQAINSTNNVNGSNVIDNHQTQLSINDAATHRCIARQPSLARQSSLTLRATLCRKTVDEVWSEIHQGGKNQQNDGNDENNSNNVQNMGPAHRRPIFREMTLEDFLVKAGVVREQYPDPSVWPAPPQKHFGLYQSNNNPVMSPGFGTRPIMGMTGICSGSSNSGNAGPSFQQMPPGRSIIGTESSTYVGSNEKRSSRYSVTQPQPPPPPQQVIYERRVGNGGGFTSAQAIGVVPSSSEAMCNSQQVYSSSGSQFAMDQMGGIRKKRIIDGPVEKVVERRQRRMIKNRESAARSRARKQAYTVELEAELNQLKEENNHLKQALAEMERKRKQRELKMKSPTKTQKAKEKMRTRKRNLSCPL